MSTASIAVTLSTRNDFPSDLHAAELRVPNSVAWRRAILLNRSARLSAWPRHFPLHSFYDLHLISPIDRANSYWDGEDWKRAARNYHNDRRRGRL